MWTTYITHKGTLWTTFKQTRATPFLKLNFKQNLAYLSLNNLLDVNQSDFQSGCSTKTALLKVGQFLLDVLICPLCSFFWMGSLSQHVPLPVSLTSLLEERKASVTYSLQHRSSGLPCQIFHTAQYQHQLMAFTDAPLLENFGVITDDKLSFTNHISKAYRVVNTFIRLYNLSHILCLVVPTPHNRRSHAKLLTSVIL